MGESEPAGRVWIEGSKPEIFADEKSDSVRVQTAPGGCAKVTVTRADGRMEEWLVQPRPGNQFNAYNIVGGVVIFNFIPVRP